jgi:hypothetical protein
MFISTMEKRRLQNLLDAARNEIEVMKPIISALEKRVMALEKKIEPPKPIKLSEAELKLELKKARQRSYAKSYYQRKKEREQVLNVGS